MSEDSEFPEPNRSDYTPDPSVDPAWAKGVFSDGRPYRTESWTADGVLILTVFVSSNGLTEMSDADLGDLLEREGLVRFVGKRYVDSRSWIDASGNPMLSISIVARDEDETYAKIAI